MKFSKTNILTFISGVFLLNPTLSQAGRFEDFTEEVIKLGLRRTCNLSSQLNCKSYI
ncbi:MAG: hypothetical protein AB8G05_19485 [Oligoflexales bacterium]